MNMDVVRRSLRSRAPLTEEHLARLSALAQADHQAFTRVGGRAEYRDRRLLVVLAQGAAQHFVDMRHGVKDLDVWTFYAQLPGQRFPADRRETHADFGPSVFGRQCYDLGKARNSHELSRWERWNAYQGRRVDFLIRALPIEPGVVFEDIVAALQVWLDAGATSKAAKKPSAWWLARSAVVIVDPLRHRGQVVWPQRWPPLTHVRPRWNSK